MANRTTYPSGSPRLRNRAAVTGKGLVDVVVENDCDRAGLFGLSVSRNGPGPDDQAVVPLRRLGGGGAADGDKGYCGRQIVMLGEEAFTATGGRPPSRRAYPGWSEDVISMPFL